MAKNGKSKRTSKRMGPMAVAKMNAKHHGGEPRDNGTWKWEHALNWYSLNRSASDAKVYLLEYLEENELWEDHAAISRIHERIVHGFGSAACWMARMMTVGKFEFDDAQMEKFASLIERIREKDAAFASEEKVTVTKPKFNPAAAKAKEDYFRVANMAMDAINIFEPKIGNTAFNIVGELKAANVSPILVRELIDEVREASLELTDAHSEANTEAAEIFDDLGYAPAFFRKKIELTQTIIHGAQSYIEERSRRPTRVDADGKVVERKVRAPKPISPEKRVSRVRFRAEDPVLGVKSIAPAKILGAKELWVFNDKYGQLQVYRSTQGLDVHGTTLVNFDEEQSFGKRVGRHAEYFVGEVTTRSKVNLRTLMDEVQATPFRLNGRLNENCIILRAL